MNSSVKIILILLSIISARVSAEEHNIIGCRIYDMNKKLIRSFPGQLCTFLPDGSFLSAQNDNLAFFNKDLKQNWIQPMHVHHQINRTENNNYFLLQTSEVKDKIRYDVLKIFDKKGNIRNEYSFLKNRKSITAELAKHGLKPKDGSISWVQEVFPDAKAEFSHVNSFYEIPKNKSEVKLTAFKKGNFIVNSTVLKLIFILDKDLKKILWSLPTAKSSCEASHDAQITPNGNVLFLCNIFGTGGGTRIIEYSPIEKKTTWLYPPIEIQSPMRFESSGGVQILENGNILFNDLTKSPRAIEISRDAKEIWSLDYPFHDSKTGSPTPFQQIKRQNLSEFIKNNSSF